MDEEIKKVMDARGSLEYAIRVTVERLVREWEKKNGARVSGVGIHTIPVGIGPKRWFEFGYVGADVLLRDGTQISGYEIRRPVPPKEFE